MPLSRHKLETVGDLILPYRFLHLTLKKRLSESATETRLPWKLGQRLIQTGKGEALEDFKGPSSVTLSKYVFAWIAKVQVFDYVY